MPRIPVYVTYDTECKSWNIMSFICCQTYFKENDFVEGQPCPIDTWFIDNPEFIEVKATRISNE